MTPGWNHASIRMWMETSKEMCTNLRSNAFGSCRRWFPDLLRTKRRVSMKLLAFCCSVQDRCIGYGYQFSIHDSICIHESAAVVCIHDSVQIGSVCIMTVLFRIFSMPCILTCSRICKLKTRWSQAMNLRFAPK